MNIGVVERMEAELQCHICLEAPQQPCALPCEHHFCSECIKRALRDSAVCPVCKADAPRRSLRIDEPVAELVEAVAEVRAALQAAPAPDRQKLGALTPAALQAGAQLPACMVGPPPPGLARAAVVPPELQARSMGWARALLGRGGVEHAEEAPLAAELPARARASGFVRDAQAPDGGRRPHRARAVAPRAARAAAARAARPGGR